MTDQPDTTPASAAPPAALTTVLRTAHDADRYEVGLPGLDEPTTIRVRNRFREERRRVDVDHRDRCTLTDTTLAGVEFHVERLHITWHSSDQGETYRFDSVTLGGHAVGVIDSIEIRYYQTLTKAPEWLPALIDFVRP